MVTGSCNQSGWVIDPGATCHIASEKRLFDSIYQVSSTDLNVANMLILVEGKGNCRVRLENAKGIELVALITDVLCAPYRLIVI